MMHFTVKENVGKWKPSPHRADSTSMILQRHIGAYNPQHVVKKPDLADGLSIWNSFYIHDLENRRLHCTIWNEYVDQLTSYLSTPREDLVIVLLHLCRINKRWGDAKGIATSFHVSKLLLDEHIPEIEDFHIRYLSIRDSTSQPSGHPLSSSGVSVDDGREAGFTRPISELASAKGIRRCWFYGEISSILSCTS